MGTSIISQDSINGLTTLTCRNEFVEITVVPEMGAKIWSLLDLRTGKEWLWRPDQDALSARDPHPIFTEGYRGAADECIPTIDPCRWNGLDLPDHGEAWSRAWDVDEADLDEGRMTMSVVLPLSQIAFSRSMQLVDSTVQLSYRAENLTAEPIPFLWAFHPMFTLLPGDMLELPEECVRVRVQISVGVPGAKVGDSWDWPQPTPEMNLARFDFGVPNGAAKLYTDPLTSGIARLLSPASQTSLTMEFSGDFVNTYGIWMSQGGWNGYRHVALEPSTGAPDALDIAVNDWKRFAVLAPGQVAEWQLTITLETA